MPRYRSRVRVSYPAPHSEGKPAKASLFAFRAVCFSGRIGLCVDSGWTKIGPNSGRTQAECRSRVDHDGSPLAAPLAALWCPEPDLNRHAMLVATDFKSAVSTDFTIGASKQCKPRRGRCCLVSHIARARWPSRHALPGACVAAAQQVMKTRNTLPNA